MKEKFPVNSLVYDSQDRKFFLVESIQSGEKVLSLINKDGVLEHWSKEDVKCMVNEDALTRDLQMNELLLSEIKQTITENFSSLLPDRTIRV